MDASKAQKPSANGHLTCRPGTSLLAVTSPPAVPYIHCETHQLDSFQQPSNEQIVPTGAYLLATETFIDADTASIT